MSDCIFWTNSLARKTLVKSQGKYEQNYNICYQLKRKLKKIPTK